MQPSSVDSVDHKAAARSAWGKSPAGWTHAAYLSPGTKEFFERVRESRATRELNTVLQLIPFAEMRGKAILEVGCGAGYDAWEFCRQGAHYCGIDLVPENIDRVCRHLGFYGYQPDVREADAENLPFPPQSFDVVFSNGVLHHTPDIKKAVTGIHQVLRSNGEFWMIVYHRHSIFHWLTLVLCDYILRLRFLKQSYQDVLSGIEYTKSSEKPLVKVFSRSEVKRLLEGAGFDVRELQVRKLEHADLPGYAYLRPLLNLIPQQPLDMLGRRWGWYIVAHAIKAGGDGQTHVGTAHPPDH